MSPDAGDVRTSRFARVLRAGVLLGVAVAAWGRASPGAAQEFRYSGALQYSTGSYVFDSRTHSVYLSSGLSLSSRRFEVSASLPMILQNGGIVAATAMGPIPTGGKGHGIVAARRDGRRIPTGRGRGGMAAEAEPVPGDSVIAFRDTYRLQVGDPTARLSVELFSGWGTLRSLRLGAGAKAPIASLESGAGTGAWDATVGGSVTLGAGRFLILGSVDYWWMGDLPELPLRDGASWAFSAGLPAFRDRGNVLVSLMGSNRLIETVDRPLSAGIGLGYRLAGGWSLSGGLSAGLSEASPDLSLFLGWSRGF